MPRWQDRGEEFVPQESTCTRPDRTLSRLQIANAPGWPQPSGHFPANCGIRQYRARSELALIRVWGHCHFAAGAFVCVSFQSVLTATIWASASPAPSVPSLRAGPPPPAHGRMEDSALHVLPCAKRGRGGREADGGGKPQGHSTVPPQPAPCSTQATSPAPHTWRHPPPVHKPARSSASCRFDWKESVTSSPFATASDYDRNRTHLRQSTPCPLASYSRPENPEAGHRDVLGWRLDH